MTTILQGDSIASPELDHSTGVTHPLVLLQSAIDRGLDPDKLGRLMDLAERWEANQAAKAFDNDMGNCQAELKDVRRDKQNTHTHSSYASYESLNSAIRPTYTKWGFSLSFSEEDCPIEGSMRLVVDVAHRGGCVRRKRLDIPLDGQGIKGNANMTPTQAKMSTISYARRGLAKMVFNLAETDEDNDGNSSFATADQLKEINSLIDQFNELGKEQIDLPRFLAWLGVDALEKLDDKGVAKAINQLKRDILEAQKGGRR